MTQSSVTRDHEEIRRWADARGAVPSEVAGTQSENEPGILRFQFPDFTGEKDRNLREISWDLFFDKFDESGLELVFQEKTAAGEVSNFNKLVHAEGNSRVEEFDEDEDDDEDDKFGEDDDDEEESVSEEDESAHFEGER